MTDPILLAALGLIGGLIGLGADRLARRWPEHEADYARSRVDSRTAVVIATGTLAAAGLGARFADDPNALLVYALLFLPLIVLLATDLDQRLLPDELTLPLIVFAAGVLLINASPALADKSLGLASGIGAGIGAPVLLLVSDRILGGQLGLGDVKLSISLGLMFGVSALFYGLLVAGVGFSVVLVGLIVARRLSLKSVVPFGPVLVFAGFVAALLS